MQFGIVLIQVQRQPVGQELLVGVFFLADAADIVHGYRFPGHADELQRKATLEKCNNYGIIQRIDGTIYRWWRRSGLRDGGRGLTVEK